MQRFRGHRSTSTEYLCAFTLAMATVLFLPDGWRRSMGVYDLVSANHAAFMTLFLLALFVLAIRAVIADWRTKGMLRKDP